VRVDQPLVRGVPLKDSDEEVEGKWFDIKYERVPHFCFDCGRLVHLEEGCTAERVEVKQWGEWLRASPRKSQKQPAGARPTVSSASYNFRQGEFSQNFGGGVVIKDLPPRRHLAYDQVESGSSRTGGLDQRRERVEVNSPLKDRRGQEEVDRSGKEVVDAGVKKNKKGTYV
jgi:hypothetical protein